jgi:hypothetical protein
MTLGTIRMIETIKVIGTIRRIGITSVITTGTETTITEIVREITTETANADDEVYVHQLLSYSAL